VRRVIRHHNTERRPRTLLGYTRRYPLAPSVGTGIAWFGVWLWTIVTWRHTACLVEAAGLPGFLAGVEHAHSLSIAQQSRYLIVACSDS